MFFKRFILNIFKREKINLLYLTSLFILNICVNSFMSIKLLYLDDLYTWDEFSKMGDIQMIFNTAANKFRPVYYLILNLCYKLFLPRVYLFGIFTLMLNFIIIVLIFYVILKTTNQPFLAFCGSAVYTFSRFAYYNISQVHGIMEEMALLTATLILFLLLKFLLKNNDKSFYFACILLFFIPFIHERYMVMYPLFIVAIFLNTKSIKYEKLKYFIFSTLSFVIPFLVRILFLKNRAFDGTGGSDMKETFNFNDFLKHFKSGMLYLFGINDGPAYLNGIEQENALKWVKFFNTIFIIVVLIIAISYFFFIIRDILRRNEGINQLKITILIISFIFFTLVCACATIRLEMRWVYTPYVGFIILLCNMLSYIKKYMKNYIVNVLIITILSITMPTELYFRSNYRNLYYWRTYQIYNSFFEQTFNRYKSELWNKKIILLSKEINLFGKDGQDLQKSLKMINPNKLVDIELYGNKELLPENYFNNDMNIILCIDDYNQKVVNLKDLFIKN